MKNEEGEERKKKNTFSNGQAILSHTIQCRLKPSEWPIMAGSGKDREERREGKKKRRKKKGRKKRKEKEKEGFAIISTVHRAIPSRARKKRYVLHYDFHAINHLAIVPIEFPNNS